MAFISNAKLRSINRDGVFLVLPSNSSLPSDERERLQELGLYKIDFRMRIGTFRSGMAKSLDQNFRKKSRSLARSLIKRYGEASGYIKKKQLAYWTNLDNGATKLKYWIQTQPYHLLRASYESTNIQSQIEENKLLQAIQNLP